VRNNVGDEIIAALDQEIESPATVDASLPEIWGFVVLLGLQGRMPFELLAAPRCNSFSPWR
jgi:hypothetical protein